MHIAIAPLILIAAILIPFALIFPKVFKVFASLVLGSALGGCTWSMAALAIPTLATWGVFAAFMVVGISIAGAYVARE